MAPQAGIEDHEVGADANRHEDQTEGKDGVDIADDLVNRTEGSNDVIEEYDHNPPVGIESPLRGHSAQQFGRTAHEGSSQQNQQDADEDAHHLAGEIAEIGTDDFRKGGTVHADAHHRGQIVMHSAGEDAAKDDPQIGSGSELGTHDGTEDGSKAGDVEELHHIDLPRRHRNIIHTILLGIGRCFAVLFRMEHAADKAAVGEIANNQCG